MGFWEFVDRNPGTFLFPWVGLASIVDIVRAARRK